MASDWRAANLAYEEGRRETPSMKPKDVTVHNDEVWMIVGRTSADSMLVRGGERPVMIRVNHGDSLELIRLVEDANLGIQARRELKDQRERP
jgi:hypothetical protein